MPREFQASFLIILRWILDLLPFTSGKFLLILLVFIADISPVISGVMHSRFPHLS